jgi:hypothetical protein
MSWEEQIRKSSMSSEIERAREIVRKLRKQYKIKTEHTEGLDEILLELLKESKR